MHPLPQLTATEENKFEDKESSSYLSKLLPLNLYGWSKHIFDKFVIKQKTKPRQFVGLKFFNVYGPNEFHKDEMRSIVLKVFKKFLITKKLNFLNLITQNLKMENK